MKIEKSTIKGFTLVELIVSLSITAMIMLGMSMFFASSFKNVFEAQQNLEGTQGHFVINDIIRNKFSNLTGVVGAPSDDVIIKNKIKEGILPFTYIGESGGKLVFKDFFMFKGMYEDEPSTDYDVKNPAGITQVGSTYYVVAPLENAIYSCSNTDNCSKFIDTELKNPIDITTNGTDTLYVTDAGNNRIVEIDVNTKNITNVAQNLNFPVGIDFYNDGTNDYLFFSEPYKNKVYRVKADGTGSPEVVVGNGDNTACDNSALYCKLDFPTGLHVNGTDLYIADTGSGRILKMSDPGLLNTATISFTPSDSNLNIGLIKVTFENMTNLSDNLQATNQSSDLHIGAYENSGNEFLYKFYTKLTNAVQCTEQYNEFGDLVGCTPYNSIEVDDGYLLNGDVIEIESSSYILNITSDFSGSPSAHNIDPSGDSHSAGSNIILTNNKYSNEQFFDLDLTGATGIADYNLVKIQIFEANVGNTPPYNDPSTEPEKTMILRNGNNILGTPEDIITVQESGLNYPTGVYWNGSLQKGEGVTFSTDGATFDYTTDFEINNLSFELLNGDKILQATITIDAQEYIINGAIPTP